MALQDVNVDKSGGQFVVHTFKDEIDNLKLDDLFRKKLLSCLVKKYIAGLESGCTIDEIRAQMLTCIDNFQWEMMGNYSEG